MRKALLLGPRGQLGSTLYAVLSNSLDEVIPLTRSDCDLAQWEYIEEKLTPWSDCDVIINCAAYTDTVKAESHEEEAITVNALGVLALARFAQKTNKLLIHFSTDFIFDGRKREPYEEEDLPQPLNVYGASKLMGEHFLRAYHDRFFLFRLSSVFGGLVGETKPVNFVEKILAKAQRGDTLSVVNDQWMSPTSTEDVALCVQAFLQQQVTEYGTYHLTNRGSCSWFDFAQEILTQANLNNDLRSSSLKDFPSAIQRPQYSVMDCHKVTKYFTPRSWQEALGAYLQQRKIA